VSSCGVDLASTARLRWPDRPGPGPVATLEATLRRGLVARHELRLERGTVRLGRFLLPALASLPLNLVVVPTGGILIAGVGLISLVMIWGNRMRRIARQPLPTVAPRDELWYLKNKKRDQTQTTGEPTAADEAGE